MKKYHLLKLSILSIVVFSNCKVTKIIESRNFSRSSITQIDSTRVVVRFDSNMTKKEIDSLKELMPIDDSKTLKCECGDNSLELWTWDYSVGSAEIQGSKDGLTGGPGGAQGDWPFTFSLPELDPKSDPYRLTDTKKLGIKGLGIYLSLPGSLIAPSNPSIGAIGTTDAISDLSPKLTIAVIDTGIDHYKFRKLDPFLYSTEGVLDNCQNQSSGWNFVNNTNNVNDDHGHGTYVTRLILKELQNYDIDYKILPIKVFNSEGYGKYWDIVCALGYINEIQKVNNDIHIVNASFGYGFSQSITSDILKLDYKENSILKSLIDELAQKSLVVASSGNIDDLNIDILGNENFPASHTSENILAVGGHEEGSNDSLTPAGSYGNVSVDLAAPFTGLKKFWFPWEIVKKPTGTSYSTAFTTGRFARLFYSHLEQSTMPGTFPIVIKNEFLNIQNGWIKEAPYLRSFYVDGKYVH